MLTNQDLEQALAAIRTTAPVRAEEVTASTNAAAAAMAAAGDPEWTIVAAGHQTEGRGRLDRTWEDVAGHALLVSFVLRPTIPPNKTGLLALLAGASMAGAIRKVAGRRVTCKWPNDLLLNGQKVGGILLESSVSQGRVDWVVVGVGVNLQAPEGVEDAVGIGEVPMRDLLIAFLQAFRTDYDAVEPSLGDRVKRSWLTISATIGRLVEATSVSGEVVQGRAVGVDDFGSLQLSTDTGEVRIAFGDIEHLDER
jgi:BirA family biotin operon repressor/biotin-[acetyl-CoA-carboxylase] ligase